jgi:hypothetical protein
MIYAGDDISIITKVLHRNSLPPTAACDYSHHYHRQHTRNSMSLFTTSTTVATTTTTTTATGAPADSRLQYPPFTVRAATVVNNACGCTFNPRLHGAVLKQRGVFIFTLPTLSDSYDHLRY